MCARTVSAPEHKEGTRTSEKTLLLRGWVDRARSRAGAPTVVRIPRPARITYASRARFARRYASSARRLESPMRASITGPISSEATQNPSIMLTACRNSAAISSRVRWRLNVSSTASRWVPMRSPSSLLGPEVSRSRTSRTISSTTLSCSLALAIILLCLGDRELVGRIVHSGPERSHNLVAPLEGALAYDNESVDERVHYHARPHLRLTRRAAL